MFTSKHPSKCSWLNLSEGEIIEEWTHPSLVPELPNIIGPPIMGLIAAIVLYANNFYPFGSEAFLLIGVGAIIGFLDYLKIINTYYVVTNEKVVKKKNIIRTDPKKAWFEDIQHIDSYKGVWERILNLSDIKIATAGTGTEEFFLDNVRNPQRFLDVLNEKKTETGNQGQTVNLSEEAIESLNNNNNNNNN